jgi:catechol 2,3-dioxygenase-like lactoylglutathione lyase family enzyme
MELSLGRLRQIGLPSGNLSKSVQFYRDTLGLEFIAQFDSPGLAFFRLGETRLLLEQSSNARATEAVMYFDVADIHTAYLTLKERGVEFDSVPHLIYQDGGGKFGSPGGEEWMAFFKDPDGNVLALASRIAASAA